MASKTPFPPGCVLCGVKDCSCTEPEVIGHRCRGCHTRRWLSGINKSSKAFEAPICNGCWIKAGGDPNFNEKSRLILIQHSLEVLVLEKLAGPMAKPEQSPILTRFQAFASELDE